MSEIKKKGLGRGLSALFGDQEASPDKKEIQTTQKIALIGDLNLNKFQPRIYFDDNKLKELAASIKKNGIIQPIAVREDITDPGRYEIVAGERRWMAAQKAGLHQVPIVVLKLNDNQALEIAIVENIQREDLNVIEEANAYKGLVNIKNINNESLAKLIGKSPSYVSNILRLLELDKKIQEMVINGDLSMGHARALIGVPDAINKANEIVEKKLSVRQTEKITSEFKKNKKNKIKKDPNIIDLEKELSDKIGLRTSIQFNESGSSGSLTLYYSDLNQLDDLMKRLKK